MLYQQPGHLAFMKATNASGIDIWSVHAFPDLGHHDQNDQAQTWLSLPTPSWGRDESRLMTDSLATLDRQMV